MRNLYLLVGCVWGIYVLSCTREIEKNVFPDGTVIPAWFSEVTKVKLEDLGAPYQITDFGAVKDSTVRNIELECDVFFDIAITEHDRLVDFTFENLAIKAQNSSYDKDLIKGLTLTNVVVNDQLIHQ